LCTLRHTPHPLLQAIDLTLLDIAGHHEVAVIIHLTHDQTSLAEIFHHIVAHGLLVAVPIQRVRYGVDVGFAYDDVCRATGEYGTFW
jgi:hypothetical protein